LESKSSDLATPSYLSQSRPNLKVWTPTRLKMALTPSPSLLRRRIPLRFHWSYSPSYQVGGSCA